MRLNAKALALIAALTLASPLAAAPRGADPGLGFMGPVRRIVKIVKQILHVVSQDEPQQPPPKP